MTDYSTNRNYAFIGGGSTGPILLIYLAIIARQNKLDLHNFTFHLIDPNGYCNGGIAYGKNAPQHILNTRRNEMSPWESNAFRKYVISQGRGDSDLQFDLRSDFHDFLYLEFSKAKRQLQRQGCTFIEYASSAYIRRSTRKGFDIVGPDSRLLSLALKSLPSENIILTVGYGPNDFFAQLRKFDRLGYIDSLYPPDSMINMLTLKLSQRNPVRIAVLGSSAALYDFVLACPLRPSEVNLFVFSSAKKGQEARQVEIEHTLKDIEFRHLDAVSTMASAKDIEQAIGLEFADAAARHAGPKTWVAFRIMGRIATVLQRVDAKTAQQFRSSLFFKKIRRLGNPTSAFSKAKLDEYQPTFIPKELRARNIGATSKGEFEIKVDGKTYYADCIVNASGHGRHNSSILEDMKDKGLAEVEPKLGVLRTDETGLRLEKSEIICVGPAVHFGTDGIETFAKPARKVAESIAAAIAARSSPVSKHTQHPAFT